ncbi:unnamed protein product [Durusdinium trenchii]|uniref:Uncharacterized protein n=1 Tax=Durusdinium trenchii TaxID=1381693 RepID=A0ABP0M0D4_9DINO
MSFSLKCSVVVFGRHQARKSENSVFCAAACSAPRWLRQACQALFNSCCPLGFLDGEEKKVYTRQYKRLCTLLSASGPGSLAKRLKSQELMACQVPGMSDEELRSPEQQQQLVAARSEGLQVRRAKRGGIGPPWSDYMCGKCSSQNCSRQEVQTGWHNDHQDAPPGCVAATRASRISTGTTQRLALPVGVQVEVWCSVLGPPGFIQLNHLLLQWGFGSS